MSQVNLLPPELLARQKMRKLTLSIVAAGVVVLALLVGFWFLQGQKLSGVNEDVAAQNARNGQLQEQINGLSQAQALQAEAASKRALLVKAFAGEVSFSQVLMDLSRAIPSDAYLKSFNATLTGAPAAGGATPAPGAPVGAAFVGSFTAEGGADGFESLASWLTRLESVRGWVNPWVSAATETAPGSGLYDFSSGADLSSDVLTGRGREGAAGA